MSPKFLEKQSSRREMLRNSAGLTGSALLAQLFPASLLSAGVPGLRQQAATSLIAEFAALQILRTVWIACARGVSIRYALTSVPVCT